MIETQTLFLFSAASFALAVTPGPDMVLVAARSAAQGRWAGFVTQLGISAGSIVHAIILALGLSQLFLAIPYAYDVVRFIGAAYLLYLAWQVLWGQRKTSANSRPTKRLSVQDIFRQGLFSCLLNPKVALFFLALFPQFLDPEKGVVALQIMVLAIIFVMIDFAVHAGVIWLAGGVRSFSTSRWNLAKYAKYFLGAVFGGLAVRLIFDSQR